MSPQERRRIVLAANAANAAIRKLADAFEIHGLARSVAASHAAKIVNDATWNVQSTISQSFEMPDD